MVIDGLEDIQELDLGGECVAVVDVWVTIWPIPAVHWMRYMKKFMIQENKPVVYTII